MTLLDYAPKRSKPARRIVTGGLYQAGGKRMLDLAICCALLPLVVPVIFALWCGAVIMGRSGFFGHVRVGRNGKAFRCWKIRTMVADADSALATVLQARPDKALEWSRSRKLENDPRIFPFGRFLRWTSLDELPQIWNVITGDMSLVGPRPVTRVELRYYGDALQDYYRVRPGITGLWQVKARQNACYVQRVALDRRYSNTVSLGRDLGILAQTVPLLFRPTGR